MAKPTPRPLKFNCYNCILGELDKLEGKPYRKQGKWSLGQVAEHLASGINASIDGFGFKLNPAYRLLGMLVKNNLLANGIKPGIKFNNKAAVVFKPDPNITDQRGVELLRAAIDRAKQTPPDKPSPILGKLTSDEWQQFHCRHAELHLGMIVPEPEPEAE